VILCDKNGLTLSVPATAAQVAGETISVRFPSERRYWMPGYFCTLGGRAIDPDLRIYLNVKPQSAAWLARTITEKLEHSGASYQLKLLNHPRRYTRPDAAVLYVGRDSVDEARTLVKLISVTPALRPQTPALARSIHPGIAVADEPLQTPGRFVSFGEHRCRILARALARAHAACVQERVHAILREFEAEGLDPARPYASGSQGIAADF
jgi:hypothetical protein